MDGRIEGIVDASLAVPATEIVEHAQKITGFRRIYGIYGIYNQAHCLTEIVL